MKLFNFNTAYTTAVSLYDIQLNELEFEDIGMIAWNRIGSKHTRLYRYTTNTIDNKILLPCNCDIIESVTINDIDYHEDEYNNSGMNTELYIDQYKTNQHSISDNGKFLKYREEGDSLVFDTNYNNVSIIYHGVINDEETGLPLINDKEIDAIAAYLAYSYLFKQSLKLRDRSSLEMANYMNAQWMRLCNNARIPDHISQNEMDKILDVRTRWDRKRYNKSFKPII